MAKDTRFAVLHHDHVFDTDASPVGQVDARFDSEDHAVRELVFRCLSDAGQLVHLQPESVAESVAEVLAVAGLTDHGVGQHVRLLAGHPLFDEFGRGLLGGENDVVDLLELVVRLAQEDRAREVGDVAIERDAHIDDDALAALEGAVAREAVRHRCPRPAADDRREGDAVAAVLADVLLDLPGHLLFRPARLDPLRNVLEGSVADVDRGLDRGQLLRLLDHAQPLDHVRCRDQLRPLCLRQVLDGLPQRTMALIGDVRGFKRDAFAAQPLQHIRQPLLHAADGLVDAVFHRLLGGLLPVAEVGGEHGVIVSDQQVGGRAGEAGEVAAVDRAGRLRTDDEERVELVLVQLLA